MCIESADCAVTNPPPLSLHWDAKQHDSRYVNLLNRIDTIIAHVSHSPACHLSVLIGELHNMTLNQTFSEEAHMVSIRYHGYGHHLHDHHRLAIATARLRNEAELGLCTVQELQTLREQWVQHIQCFDNALESHLIANQAQAGLDDKNS